MNNRLAYHLELLQETLQRLEKAEERESNAVGEEILQQFRDLIDQLEQYFNFVDAAPGHLPWNTVS